MCVCIYVCVYIYTNFLHGKKKNLGRKFSILITVPGLKHEVHCKERRLGDVLQSQQKKNSPGGRDVLKSLCPSTCTSVNIVYKVTIVRTCLAMGEDVLTVGEDVFDNVRGRV